MPVAAALFSERVAHAAAFGDHGSTYGGNLLACRAALVFLEELIDGGLMAHVAEAGAHLETRLRALAAGNRGIQDVRGAGLMWGIELDRPAAPVVEAALERGLLINRTSETVVRLLPPFVITAAEIDEGDPTARRGARRRVRGGEQSMTTVTLRRRGRRRCRRHAPADRRDNLEVGHLLPRTIDDIERARRPLHRRRCWKTRHRMRGAGAAQRHGVAEVRSLVVDEALPRPAHRRPSGDRAGRGGDGARARDAVRVHARAVAFRPAGLHDRAARVGAGKDRARLHGCPLFRRCGQYAVTLPLRAGRQIRPGAACRRDLRRPHGRARGARTSSGSSCGRCDDEPPTTSREPVPA